MLTIYRIFINIIFILSPIIILIRLIYKKEDIRRFKEKIGFFKKKKLKGKLIWFHGASVGELKSVLPIIEKLIKNSAVDQILITSNTLSSSKIAKKIESKKIIHQFFPIDTNFISKKFIKYWKPSKVIFIDSEIWPNTIKNLKENGIPIYLLNARITKKTFEKWFFFKKIAKEIFLSFNLFLTSNIETIRYLKKLSAKNIKYIGNLKFSETEEKNLKINNKFKKFCIKKKIWCASSTHDNEEIICGTAHLKLKKKIKNIFTIIIPRHIERSKNIKINLEKMGLKVHLDSSQKSILKDTDIYLVDSYGKTKLFFNESKIVFLGGSLIDHGGQNPIEAARLGCKILAGKNIYNFKEIYQFLKKKNILQYVHDSKTLAKKINLFLNKDTSSENIKKQINYLGKKILDKTYKELNF